MRSLMNGWNTAQEIVLSSIMQWETLRSLEKKSWNVSNIVKIGQAIIAAVEFDKHTHKHTPTYWRQTHTTEYNHTNSMKFIKLLLPSSQSPPLTSPLSSPFSYPTPPVPTLSPPRHHFDKAGRDVLLPRGTHRHAHAARQRHGVRSGRKGTVWCGVV